MTETSTFGLKAGAVCITGFDHLIDLLGSEGKCALFLVVGERFKADEHGFGNAFFHNFLHLDVPDSTSFDLLKLVLDLLPHLRRRYHLHFRHGFHLRLHHRLFHSAHFLNDFGDRFHQSLLFHNDLSDLLFLFAHDCLLFFDGFRLVFYLTLIAGLFLEAEAGDHDLDRG